MAASPELRFRWGTKPGLLSLEDGQSTGRGTGGEARAGMNICPNIQFPGPAHPLSSAFPHRYRFILPENGT